MPPTERRPGETVTVGEAAERWYEGLEAQHRRSLLTKTRSYLDGRDPAVLEEHPPGGRECREVERFQTSVLARKRTCRDRDSGKIEEAPIRVKTARNIVGGHFRLTY
jgi:hypothetical protein